MRERLDRDPLCPKCGGRTQVRATLPSRTDGTIIRRRFCRDCDHRFYTRQGEKAYVPDHLTVRYVNKKHGKAVWLVDHEAEVTTAA